MNYTLFNNYFPEVAENETRTLHVPPNHSSGLPAGDYTFMEMFCDEKGCDCRRVFFYVVASFIPLKDPAAVIAYGWESRKFYVKWMGDDDPLFIDSLKGPALNLASPQSRFARPILQLAKSVLLKDQAYIDRVKKHYRMFKDHIDAQPDKED